MVRPTFFVEPENARGSIPALADNWSFVKNVDEQHRSTQGVVGRGLASTNCPPLGEPEGGWLALRGGPCGVGSGPNFERGIGMRHQLKAAAKRIASPLLSALLSKPPPPAVVNYEKTRLNDNQVFLGYPFSDLAALAKYMAPNLEGAPGFHVDCFGIKTRYSYFSDATDSQAIQANLPFPDNTLYGEAIEFLATCRAVDAADEEMVAYEFGAGFAPWLVCTAAMALRRPVKRLRLVAVEADPQRLPLIEQHFSDNGLPLPGASHPIVSTEIIQAAVSDQRGTLTFSAQGIKDWGGAASKDKSAADYRGATGNRVSVPALPISELLQHERVVDLVHMDIQGFEYLSIAASLDDLNRKVRSIVIGTHSRVIEGRLIDLLRQNGWVLIYEKPCKFHASSQLPDVTGATYFDGTQFWINQRLWPAHFQWQPDLTPQATAALRSIRG